MDDYLALGTLLEEYIRAEMPGSPVQQLTELSAIEAVTLRGHLICVAYAGELVVESKGRAASIRQRWLTVVSVQSAGKAQGGQVARAKAGPILMALGEKLQGRMFEGFKALNRLTPPPPRHAAGFAHFPLAWEAELTIVGEK